jgi:hypothetical protein
VETCEVEWPVSTGKQSLADGNSRRLRRRRRRRLSSATEWDRRSIVAGRARITASMLCAKQRAWCDGTSEAESAQGHDAGQERAWRGPKHPKQARRAADGARLVSTRAWNLQGMENGNGNGMETQMEMEMAFALASQPRQTDECAAEKGPQWHGQEGRLAVHMPAGGLLCLHGWHHHVQLAR